MQRSIRLIVTLLLLASLVLGGCGLTVPEQTTVPGESVTEQTTLAPVPEATPADSQPDSDEPSEPEQSQPEQDPTSGQTQPEVPTEAPSEEETQVPTEEPTEEPTGEPTEAPTETPTQPPSSVSTGFKVHFIDVGQADAALIVCDGKTMLIDGGNSADSNLIYTYLKNRDITHLDYVIATHAHEDHVGGLSGALNFASVGTVYCPVKSYSSSAFNNFVKYVQQRGKTITVPSRGQTFSLGSATCTVLAVNTSSDTNNSSIVLRVVYGSTSFLFTGDAEREVEEALINRGAPLSSTVLKVGHHGSYTSTSYAFLWNVMPQYAVISCGKGNSYGHPHDEVLSRLHDAGVWTFRTDLQGDVTCTSNGSSVSFSVSRNWNADVFGDLGGNHSQPPATEAPTAPPATEAPTQPPATQPEQTDPPETQAPEQQGITYVLNNNSMKFHTEDCEWGQKISDRNRGEYTGDRQDLIDRGYSPCGSCQP